MKTTFTVASIGILSMGFNSAAATAEENDKRWYATADFGLSSLSSATLTYSDGTNVETANAKEAVNLPSLGNFTDGNFASLGS